MFAVADVFTVAFSSAPKASSRTREFRPSAPTTQILARTGGGASPPPRGGSNVSVTPSSPSSSSVRSWSRCASRTVSGFSPALSALVSLAHVMPICGGRSMRRDHPATSIFTSSSASVFPGWSCSIAMLSITAPASMTRSHETGSKDFNALSPCGQMKMATPAGRNSSRCSNTRTSRPARCSARAAARPPGPAPTIATSQTFSSSTAGAPLRAAAAAARIARLAGLVPRRYARGCAIRARHSTRARMPRLGARSRMDRLSEMRVGCAIF